MPVVAFLAPSVEGADDQVCVLSDVVALPKDLLGYVQKRVPTYQLSYSKTVQGKYYANVCPKCRMLSGDFFLHSEPGAPFFRPAQRKLVCFISQKYLCRVRCAFGLVFTWERAG